MARVAVRHSELKDGRQCPLKHRLRWIDGWTSGHESPKQLLGIAWHAVLQAHYETIRYQQGELGFANWYQRCLVAGGGYQGLLDEAQDTGQSVVGDWADELEDEQYKTLQWMYEGYLERFGLDLGWEVIAVEAEMAIPLIEPSGRPSKRFSFQWHGDLLVKDWSMGGKYLAIDHKSTSQPLGQHDVDLDDQFGLYTWAWTQAGYPILAPVCSQAKAQKLKRAMTLEERFTRIISYRTEVEQRNIALDALRTAKRLYGAANLEEPDSNPNPRECSWSCDFKEVHLAIRKSPQGRDAAPASLLARGFTQEDGRV